MLFYPDEIKCLRKKDGRQLQDRFPVVEGGQA